MGKSRQPPSPCYERAGGTSFAGSAPTPPFPGGRGRLLPTREPDATTREWTAAACVAVFLFVAAAAPAAELTAAEKRGLELYQTGRSPNGDEILAYFGEDKLELPGEALTCGSCHGYDGTGRPESGILPSNVTWPYLTKSYGHRHENGLEHGPFSEESLVHYMRTGVYPGGAQGDPSMPLYAMSDRDLDDLVAYLKRLGQTLAPGVSETAIRLGTVVPKTDPAAEIGRGIAGILEAQFAALNASGGIYGRKVELRVHELEGEERPDLDAARRWLAEEQPFALVSPFVPDPEIRADALLSADGAPLIGPFTIFPEERFFENRNVFYIFSGLTDQVRALLRHAADVRGAEPAQVAIVSRQRGEEDPLVEATGKACRGAGWPEPRRVSLGPGVFDAAATVRALAESGVGVVLLVAPEADSRAFLGAVAASEWRPLVLLPGILAGRLAFDAPAALGERLFLAYPTLPSDRQDSAMERLVALMRASGVAPKHLHAVVSATVAAQVAVEALRNAGRDLSRKGFIDALEELYRLETGLTPPITYTSNRRVGAQGAYVVRLDAFQRGPEGIASALWVESE